MYTPSAVAGDGSPLRVPPPNCSRVPAPTTWRVRWPICAISATPVPESAAVM